MEMRTSVCPSIISGGDEGGGKWHAGNIAVVLVGLPATGKTFTARNLSRYLQWLGVKTRTFSVAQYRKQIIGEKLMADFFDPSNAECLAKRTMIADIALQSLIDWFKEPHRGQVGILDASNTQAGRRKIIYDRLVGSGARVIFLECIYSHGYESAVCEHVRELRLTCPEYANVESAQASLDFQQRIEHYRPHYVPFGGGAGEDDLPYIKLLDGGERIVANKVCGYLQSRMLYYLMNLHHGSKRIFLYQLSTKVASLREHAEPARRYLETIDDPRTFSVWTETSLISGVVGDIFSGHELLTKPQLRARDPGLVEGLEGPEIQARFPDDYQRELEDPYRHRYPRAESYHDLVVRLENVMMELEREPKDLLIIAHHSVLQCIYAYFTKVPNRDIPHAKIPADTIVQLKPKAYGTFERHVKLDCMPCLEGPDLFRPFSE